MKVFWMAGVAGILYGCGSNCRDTERLGDFEFSQRNYERAIQLYEQAWTRDSLRCSDIKGKLEQTRGFLKPSGR